MKPIQYLLLVACSLLCLGSVLGDAQAVSPRYISYQGSLLDDTGLPVADGNYSINFRLWNAPTGGVSVWSSTRTVNVTDGIFDVILGENVTIKASRFADPLWLGIAVSGQSELVPRTQLTASAYTFRAMTVDDGSIGSDQIKDNAVVRSLNGRTGHMDLVAGPNVTITEGSTELTISAVGGTGGGDDGDWTIDGAHLYHDATGTVSLGTSSPAPMLGGQTSLQVASGFWPSITLDVLSPFQRWIILNENIGGDLFFSHTTSAPGSGTPVLVLDNDNQVGIGKVPGATLDVQAGNGDVVTTTGDLRIGGGTGSHELRFGMYTADTEAGTANIFAQSGTGTARINLGIDDHKVVTVEDYALDLYATSDLIQARLRGSTSGGRDGSLELYGDESQARVLLDGRWGNGAILNMRQVGGIMGAKLESYYSGGGRLVLYDAVGNASVYIDGSYSGGVGRILTPELEITGGADLSEQFDVQNDDSGHGSAPVPGSVVCIDPSSPGELCVSTRAYDRRVAGIISGAGGVRPGLLMGQKNSVADGEYPVALTGRVYVMADASTGAIEPGDLLTTSDAPGHAMKVVDHDRANGAILGKAMTELEEGRGLVLVLVSLQ